MQSLSQTFGPVCGYLSRSSNKNHQAMTLCLGSTLSVLFEFVEQLPNNK